MEDRWACRWQGQFVRGGNLGCVCRGIKWSCVCGVKVELCMGLCGLVWGGVVFFCGALR